MRNKKVVLRAILILVLLIIASFLLVAMTKSYFSTENKDCQKIGLKIEDYDIEYYTVYEEDRIGRNYKVYKFKNYYSDSMNEFKNQLESSELWNNNKYYEYIMLEFYEKNNANKSYVDRENLYYYHGKGAYAIFDLKNAKLYYYEGIPYYHQDFSEILGVRINDYINREIYSVRGGLQYDGTDYYVYEFDESNGEEIETTLSNSENWNQEKPDAQILESFEYNSEVLDIQNGYYYYQKICRTSDDYKKEHFTDEEATGYEVGVYDCDKHILYYYWTSI